MKVLCKNPLCDGGAAVELPEGATRCCYCGDMYHWHEADFKRIHEEEAQKAKTGAVAQAVYARNIVRFAILSAIPIVGVIFLTHWSKRVILSVIFLWMISVTVYAAHSGKKAVKKNSLQ